MFFTMTFMNTTPVPIYGRRKHTTGEASGTMRWVFPWVQKDISEQEVTQALATPPISGNTTRWAMHGRRWPTLAAVRGLAPRGLQSAPRDTLAPAGTGAIPRTSGSGTPEPIPGPRRPTLAAPPATSA